MAPTKGLLTLLFPFPISLIASQCVADTRHVLERGWRTWSFPWAIHSYVLASVGLVLVGYGNSNQPHQSELQGGSMVGQRGFVSVSGRLMCCCGFPACPAPTNVLQSLLGQKNFLTVLLKINGRCSEVSSHILVVLSLACRIRRMQLIQRVLFKKGALCGLNKDSYLILQLKQECLFWVRMSR